MTAPTVAPEAPLRLIATVSNQADFADKVGDALSQKGYGILNVARTASFLKKLELDADDLEDEQILADLKARRVDAIMKLAITMTGRDMNLLDKVQVRVTATKGGGALAAFNWANSWSGMPGSPADSTIRLSPAAAAQKIAQILSVQLGAPGPKETVYMDDVIAARRARVLNPGAAESLSPAAVPRAITSDVDSPVRRGPERPDDFALVIGIEEYQSLPRADFGVRDAQTVRKHLEALGVPPRNIVSLEGAAATGNKLQSYLEEWLPLNVKPASTLYVYYSGHGAPDTKSGDAYLVPWDGDPKFLKTTAYPLKKLYADLGKIKARRVVVALDACFSGAGGRSVLAQGARPLVVTVNDGVPATENLVVLAAASGDEITGTLNEQGHGIFTYYFLKGLSGEASKDGAVTPQSLYDYLKPRVQDEARRQNREQTPALAGAGAQTPLLK